MAEKTAIRKRQRIENSNKTMFLWVTGMSIVVGFCLVIAWFLIQQIMFHGKIIGERNKTVSVLEHNNNSVDELRKNVRLLETDGNLISTPKAEPNEKALQIILDALPADANSLALGASLQQRIVDGINDLTVESLDVAPTGEEVSAESEGSVTVSDSSETGVANSIHFRLVVSSGNSDSLRELLFKFERSIRVVDITSMQIDKSEQGYSMIIEGRAYYEPAVNLKLRKEVVKP